MRSLAMTIGVALLAASCATDTSRMAQTVSRADISVAGCGSGLSFAEEKVRVVGSFDPTARGLTYARPKGLSAAPSPARERVQQAFDASPKFFKDHLCSVDAVLLLANAGADRREAFGFFEGAGQDDGTKRYIGIPLGFVDQAEKNLPSLGSFDTDTMGLLVDPNQTDWPTWSKGGGPTVTSDRSEFSVALIGLMAHEMGHILWANGDVLDKNVCQPFAGSWTGPVKLKVPFRQFGEDDGTPVGPSKRKVNIKQGTARGTFKGIFAGSQRWASLFATASPEEDWVETYRLLVLSSKEATYPVKQLSVQQTSKVDAFRVNVVPRLTNNGVLSKKARCIADELGIPRPS